ncbi:MAG: hypothetical protein R3324_12295 [Halobacteriales archaeon]|nr:hypothetical protein [Halobacteriales archaeon]
MNPQGPLATVRHYYGIFLLAVTVFIVLRGIWDAVVAGSDLTVITFYFSVVFPGLFLLFLLMWTIDYVSVRE